MITNPIVIGNYEGVDFHYIFNENDRFMINATDIANHFKIDLSIFLENKDAKLWIDTLLKPEDQPEKNRTLEDIIFIENGIYYFHKFLIYELCKPLGMFYWWMDQFFYKLMVKHQKPLI